MLGLFSLKTSKHNETESRQKLSCPNFSSAPHGETQSEVQRPEDNGGASMKELLRRQELAKVQQSWAFNRGFRAKPHDDGANCDCCAKQQPMQQSMDEVDFDRGYAQTPSFDSILSTICLDGWGARLWGAAVRGDADRVSFLLLNRERNPNQLDSGGYAPLHYSARGGKVDVCGLLLQHKADVDLRAGEGRATALHRACSAGAAEVVVLLLSSKASPIAEDADGETPLDKASKQGHSGLVELLRSIPEVRACEEQRAGR